MKITLCMIVKDEEKNIKRCLESALGIVDDAIIVDTGSTDRTLDIIKTFGKKIQIINYNWEDDFSKARNLSIKNANGDWILVLDADEELICDKEKLISKLKDTNLNSFNVTWINVLDNKGQLDSFAYNRVFRNKGYRYYRAIHEQLDVNEKESGILEEEIFKIIHYGYTKENMEKNNKVNRNLKILLDCYNNDSEDPFVCYHLGATYASSRDYKNALDYFIRSYELGLNRGFGAYYYELIKRMSECIYLLHDYKLCIDFITQLLSKEDTRNFTDLYYIAGSCFYKMKDHENAKKMFNKCIELGESKNLPTFTGRGSFLSELMLARIYVDKNDSKNAKMFYLKVLKAKQSLSKDIIKEIYCYI
ncbi:tetratricopeptide repeat-containing glycosyltransferase family 2 protein [Clostridium sporogenes]|uniref:tetratricopeptide repeat-containing glycosyltransferase family 2 protein n=1 Tax=Clostridium sporogenes TaxID=1509 RepID=UPI0022371E8F|nr:glycosyltransferase [Clostridium sporogenes]MCW6062212.1 glycosyltransferase [Clostridium sporogenes]